MRCMRHVYNVVKSDLHHFFVWFRREILMKVPQVMMYFVNTTLRMISLNRIVYVGTNKTAVSVLVMWPVKKT